MLLKKFKGFINNKSAFTLIEVLAVITLLGVIALVVYPMITNYIENGKNDSYNIQIGEIKKAASDWTAKNISSLPLNKGETITIRLIDLKKNGLIDKNLINPKTNKKFPDDMVVMIIKTEKGFEYEVDVDSGTPGNDMDLDSPSIILNGLPYQYVEINSTYKEYGAVAVDSSGNDIDSDDIKITITKNSTKVNKIDTSDFYEYTVKYEVSDPYNGKKVSATRKVKIRDTEPPILKIPTNTSISVNQSTFDVMDGVSATDNSRKTPTITSSGNVSLGIPGTYVVEYTAKDDSGNKTKKKRTIVIENKLCLDIKVTSINKKNISNNNIILEATLLNGTKITEGNLNWQRYEGGNWQNIDGETSSSLIVRNSGKYRVYYKNGDCETYSSSYEVIIDNQAPEVNVNPSAGNFSKEIVITVADKGDSELSSSNSYQYYLSSSNTSLTNGKWENYTSGSSVTIGNNLNGTYYLFVKRIKDTAGNISSNNGTIADINNTTYHMFGPYKFDNTPPTIKVTPDSANNASSSNITIISEDDGSGLSSNNSYQYYLSSSSTTPTGGIWENYTSGQSFKIGDGKNGTYYLFVKKITDNTGNKSKEYGTEVSDYHRFGPYKFENTPPKIVVTPDSNSNYQKTSNIKISITNIGSSGLSSNNSYQYYLSSSSSSLENGSWITYNNGGTYTIGAGKSGTYYLFVKRITSGAGVVSTSNGNSVTINGVVYHKFGPYKFDNVKPTINVSPTNNNSFVNSETIKITAADSGGSGLSSSNSYQYYLSTSSSTPTGGSWTTYTSGNSFTIGAGKSGTYYLFVRKIIDNASNESSESGTIVSSYHRFGPYKFDNEAPTVNVSPSSSDGTVPLEKIKITAIDSGGSGLSSSNSYQYYLSTSSSAPTGGTWSNYVSGGTYNIGEKKSGTYYLFVKKVSDGCGNTSEKNGTIVSSYHRFGPYNFDSTPPVINVNPSSSTATKSKSITISITDAIGAGLSSSNSYQYYLSSSSTTLIGGTWTNYTSGKSFTIGAGKTGTYYLFVKRVANNAGSVSVSGGTATNISGVTYQRFGSYVFDNTAPNCPTFTAKDENGSAYPTNTWSNKKLKLTVTPTSDTAEYDYYINDKFYYTKSGTFTDSVLNGKSNGSIVIKTVVKDNLGNSRECESQKYLMDTEGPTASFKITRNTENGPAYSGGWINKDDYEKNGPPYFTLTANDGNGSGIDHYEYSHNKTNWVRDHEKWVSYGISSDKKKAWWKITWDGSWDFYIRACDTAGNCGESTPVKHLQMDITPPNAPKINKLIPESSGTAYSVKYTSNNCDGKGGGAADVTCNVTAEVCNKFYFSEDMTYDQSVSGLSHLQYIWMHDGGSSDYCPNWTNNTCGSFTATSNNVRPSYIDYRIRSVDKAGNAGYYTRMYYTVKWKFASQC